MKVFQAELLQLADRLDLPEPARTRVLLEVIGDLEAAYRANLASGLDEQSARRRALEYCDLSDEALLELGAVHGTFLRQILLTIPEAARGFWEQALVTTLVVVLALAAGAVVSTPGFWARGSVFVWPLSLLAVAAAATTLVRVYNLWIRQDHHPARLRSGHGLLLGLALAMAAWGALGFWFELAWAAAQMRLAADQGLSTTLGWLVRGSGLVTASLVAAVLTGLTWAALEHKAARCQRQALAALLEIES
jgi:hypothetical protein